MTTPTPQRYELWTNDFDHSLFPARFQAESRRLVLDVPAGNPPMRCVAAFEAPTWDEARRVADFVLYGNREEES